MWDVSLHYLWWIAAALLIAGELLAPGYFMLWIGFAAVGMGILAWFVPGLGLLTQVLLFALLAVALCVLYARVFRARIERSSPGSERLNRRAEQMIGQRYVLVEAIVNGRGKAVVGDGQWMVAGPELPVGCTVEVIGVDGATLRVRSVA